MKHQNRMSLLSLLLLGVMLAGCVAPVAAPGPTSAPPMATLQPPTATPIPPTATSQPPTATSMPPTPEPAPSAATPGPATSAATGKVHIDFDVITSQALAGNLLDDSTSRQYYLLLPPNYETSDKRYPVVYVLHGYYGGAGSDVENYQRAYEAALEEGDLQEMIFVFPDASNKFHGSMYLSSPTIGDYETYITQELVELIDATYRTIPDRDSRGITGCSMGGDGSIYLAMKYPEVFSVAVPVSGTYDWARDPILQQGAESLMSLPEDFTEFEAKSWRFQYLLALAAAVASNPDKPPFYLDMPVTVVDWEGQMVPEVFEKIAAADPVHELERYLAEPQRLNAVMIFHGRLDEYIPVELARDFDQLLTDQGVEHEYLEVEGFHCAFGLWGWVPVVQFLSDHLAGEPVE